MRLYALPFAICVALAACFPHAEPEPAVEPQPLTADMMANLMAADGAAHTVAVLTGPADPTGLDKVFAGIATGEPAWLALVPTLEPVLDGIHAEGLQNALAAALPLNAPGVLALVPDHADLRRVCSAAAAPPDVRVAVEAVSDLGLQAARTECLHALDAPPMQR